MEYEVTELVVPERPTAVVAETTTWEEWPGIWRRLLDEVWRTVRSTDRIAPGRNVMLYKNQLPSVEVGVEVAAPFASIGRVFYSALPAGRVAMTTHRGRYEDLGAGHEAVVAACARRGLERLGPLWEIYGHATENVADQEVEIYHLVR